MFVRLCTRVCIGLSACTCKFSQVCSLSNQCVYSFVYLFILVLVCSESPSVPVCTCFSRAEAVRLGARGMNQIQVFRVYLCLTCTAGDMALGCTSLRLFIRNCPQHGENRKMENNFIHFYSGRRLRAPVLLLWNNTSQPAVSQTLVKTL